MQEHSEKFDHLFGYTNKKEESDAYLISINELRLQDLFFLTQSFACSLANSKVGGLREELIKLILIKS